MMSSSTVDWGWPGPSSTSTLCSLNPALLPATSQNDDEQHGCCRRADRRHNERGVVPSPGGSALGSRQPIESSPVHRFLIASGHFLLQTPPPRTHTQLLVGTPPCCPPKTASSIFSRQSFFSVQQRRWCQTMAPTSTEAGGLPEWCRARVA